MSSRMRGNSGPSQQGANSQSTGQSTGATVLPQKMEQVPSIVQKPVTLTSSDAVQKKKESIEQEITKRQQELKALENQLKEKAKTTAKKVEDVADDELKQALEIVRKTRLEAQKRIEQEKQALEAGVKKAAEKATQKAKEVIDAGEKSVLAGAKKAGEKITEKLDAGLNKAE